MLATVNILERTFCIHYNGLATCFTIDVNNKQYIVTARHVVASIPNSGTVKIQHDGIWKDLPVNLVGHGPDDVDITVLAPDRQLSPPQHPLPPVTKGVVLGQEILFLGFPYGLMMDNVWRINRYFPIALVKHGILSAVPVGKSQTFLLDGHGNPGFSGGPVVCQRVNSKSSELAVMGVISGYKHEREPIYSGKSKTQFSYNDNTGIIYATDIRNALYLIKKNPIGFDLPTPQFRAWFKRFRP